MASKTKEERKNDSMEWLKWQWEYARRNPEVKKAYQEALELRKRAEHSPAEVAFEADTKAGKFIIDSYLETPEGQEEKRLCEALGLHFGCMIDPDKSYDDLMNGPDSMERACFWPSAFWETFLTKGPLLEGSCLNIEIDFAKFNSIDALKHEVGRMLDFYYDNLYEGYRKKHYEGDDATTKRKTDYDLILMAGDMREKQRPGKKRMTYKDIARQLSKRDFNVDNENANPESAEKNIRNLCKRYEELVNGGYRKLTYP